MGPIVLSGGQESPLLLLFRSHLLFPPLAPVSYSPVKWCFLQGWASVFSSNSALLNNLTPCWFHSAQANPWIAHIYFQPSVEHLQLDILQLSQITRVQNWSHYPRSPASHDRPLLRFLCYPFSLSRWYHQPLRHPNGNLRVTSDPSLSLIKVCQC